MKKYKNLGMTGRRMTLALSEAEAFNLDLLALKQGSTRGALISRGVDLELRHYGFPTDRKVGFTVELESCGDKGTQ